MRKALNPEVVRQFLLNEYTWVILLVFCGLLVRLWLPYDPLINTDGERDLMFARHIAFFHDYPLTGSNSSGGLLTYYPPVFQYFLAFFLVLFHSAIALRVLSLVMQLGSCLMIFFTARVLFGRGSAFPALLLSLFSFPSVSLSASLFQHPFAQVFSTAFLFLLAYGLTHKNRAALVGSMVCFWVAVAMSYASFGLAPAWALAFLVVRRWQEPRNYFWPLVAAGILAPLLLFSPLLANVLHKGIPVMELFRSRTPDLTFSGLFPRFISNASLFLGQFFRTIGVWSVCFFVVSVASVCTYAFHEKDKWRRIYLFSSFGLIVCYLGILSLATTGIYNYHLMPILGIFVIAVSEVVVRTARYFFDSSIVLAVVLFFVLVFGLKLVPNTSGANTLISDLIPGSTQHENAGGPIIASLLQEVSTLRNAHGFSDDTFFQMRMYNEQSSRQPQSGSWVSVDDAVLYNFLEEQSGHPLVKMGYDGHSDYIYSLWDYTPLGDDAYIFLVCRTLDSGGPADNCLTRFASEHQHYHVGDVIQRDGRFSLFLATREAS